MIGSRDLPFVGFNFFYFHAKGLGRLPGYDSVITKDNVSDYLGVIKFRDTVAEKHNEVGLAIGLAWTEVGGQILVTEATLMDGKGRLTLTGKLGDVMQESRAH